MRRVFLDYSQCYVYTARVQTKTYNNSLYVVSQPDLHVIPGRPLSLVPRARETGTLKNMFICDTDEKIPSTET